MNEIKNEIYNNTLTPASDSSQFWDILTDVANDLGSVIDENFILTTDEQVPHLNLYRKTRRSGHRYNLAVNIHNIIATANAYTYVFFTSETRSSDANMATIENENVIFDDTINISDAHRQVLNTVHRSRESNLDMYALAITFIKGYDASMTFIQSNVYNKEAHGTDIQRVRNITKTHVAELRTAVINMDPIALYNGWPRLGHEMDLLNY